MRPLMNPSRTSIAGSPEFKRRFLRLVAAQLDGRTCGLAGMASALLSEAPDLNPGTTVYETLEAMSGRSKAKAGLARDAARSGRAGKPA
jgi:hypothetical protein